MKITLNSLIKRLIAIKAIFVTKEMGVGVLIMLISSASQAYDIGTICKESTQGWMRLEGSCDSEGYLQGSGVAGMGDLVVFGNFSKGLPNGMHHTIFMEQSSQRVAMQEGPNGSSIYLKKRELESKNSRYRGWLIDVCKINFVNGQPADNVIHCGGIDAIAKSGNVAMALKNGSVMLSIDEANISGLRQNGSAPILQLDWGNPEPLTLTGNAASVTLKSPKSKQYGGKPGYGFYITNLNGTAAFPPKSISRRNTTHSIKGLFDFADGTVILRTVEQTGKPAVPVTEEVKYDFEVYGNKFRAAFYDRAIGVGLGSPMIAQYLKIENDIEFDGSGYELCLSQAWPANSKESWRVDSKGVRYDASGAVQITFSEDRYNRDIHSLLITPKCGKLIDKANRVYSGFFDKQGRPAPQ